MTKEEKFLSLSQSATVLFQQQKAFQAELAFPCVVCRTHAAGSWAPGGPLGGGRRAGRGAGVPEGPRVVLSRPPHEKVHLWGVGAALGPGCHGERHRQPAGAWLHVRAHSGSAALSV